VIRVLLISGLLFAGMTALAADDPSGEPKITKKAKSSEAKKDAEPTPSDIDVGKTTERIVEDATEAGKRLGAKDAGSDTQRLQREALKNIDALIRKAQEPPPPMSGDPMSSQNNSGMGATSKQPDGGMSKQPNGGNTKSNQSASRQERREKRKSLARGKQLGSPDSRQPRPDPKIALNNPSDSPNKIEPKSMAPRPADIYKEVWGHLPEKMRQEMDQYFREQFMPRYSELLKQYYSSLSERGGKSNATP
jgi:hypothetical protein